MFKILIVDNETDLLEIYSDLLYSRTRKLETCTSGEQALTLIHKQVYDLVISDKNLGAVTGLDLLHAIEAISPKTTFILMSGDRMGNINFLSKKSRSIQKPFSFPKLNSLLEEFEQSCTQNWTKSI